MPTKLHVGDRAPKIAVNDVNGRTISLDDIDGVQTSGFLLLAFLRYAGCPWCNLAIHRLVMESALLQDSNCSIIAFVQSSKHNIMTNIYERHARKPEFPIVADNNRHIFDQYAVRPSLVQSMRHITHAPHWVRAVRKEGFSQGAIDGNLFLAPAMFLVNTQTGLIVRADYNANLYEHSTFSAVYDAISIERLDKVIG